MIVQESLDQALIDGASEVFETMMFMTVEPCNDLYDGMEGQTFMGSITYKGPMEGVLTIACGEDCARQIAINMLGFEEGEELSEDDVKDAIGEVANMVMGSVKAKLMDEVGDLQVSVPTVIMGTEMSSSLKEGAKRVERTIHVDDMVACLTLIYTESAVAA